MADDDAPCACCAGCAATGADITAAAGEHTGKNEHTSTSEQSNTGTSEHKHKVVPLLIACGIPTLTAAALNLAKAEGPLLTLAAIALALVGSVIGLYLIAPAVWASIKARSININTLMVIAVLGAWLLGDFAEAATVVFLFCVGEWVEEHAIGRNRSSIERLMDLTPQIVRVRQGSGDTADAVLSDGCSAPAPADGCSAPAPADGCCSAPTSTAPTSAILELTPEAVTLGSTVVIRPGDRIPLDGIVCSGSASVDESPITGESVPVLKQAGDPVYASSLSVDGRFEFTTTATVANSTLARIVALVEESQAKRTPYERFINRFARYYTPLVVALAVLVALVPMLLTLLTPLELGGIDVWGYRALALLVIACPCALVIATPVSVVTGLTQAARMGVLVKGGAFLELAARARAIAFDKTGTLTYGKPQVCEVVPLVPDTSNSTDSVRYARVDSAKAVRFANSDSAEDVRCARILTLAAALEQDSTHPLARAVVTAATTANSAAPPAASAISLSVLPTAADVTELAGRGITGTVDDTPVAVVSPAHALSMASLSPSARDHIDRMERSAATVLVVLVDGEPLGLIAVRDVVRSESPALLRQFGRLKPLGQPKPVGRPEQPERPQQPQLQQPEQPQQPQPQHPQHPQPAQPQPLGQPTAARGLHAVMLTGDNAVTAAAIAREAGIEQVHAGLLPHEKMERVEALKREYGVVAMVGDGINDAPALALADIGIAMGAAASDTALQVADVALLGNNLEALPAFFRLARRVVRTIHTNIAFALVVKAAVMVLAIVGVAQMWVAIFADVGVLMLVLLYSMRLNLPFYRRARVQ